MCERCANTGFVDMSDRASKVHYDLDLWFSSDLWNWCRLRDGHSSTASRETGLITSIGFLVATDPQIEGVVRLKAAGEKILVSLGWCREESERSRLFVSFPKGHASPAIDLRLRGTRPSLLSPKAGVLFYFACPHCTAKWFAETGRSLCPRCRTSCESTERLSPPWRDGVVTKQSDAGEH